MAASSENESEDRSEEQYDDGDHDDETSQGDRGSTSSQSGRSPYDSKVKQFKGAPIPEIDIRDVDVYCGRDKLIQTHPGNKRFRKWIELTRNEYVDAKLRDEKTAITKRIIERVHSLGGRFLKRDDTTNLWYEVDEACAHEKVSHALRSAKDADRPRVRKPRKVDIPPPSNEEERAYQELSAKQEEFFEMLQRQNNFNSVEGGATGDHLVSVLQKD